MLKIAALIAAGGLAMVWGILAPAARSVDEPPTAAALQSAFDREKVGAKELHDNDLQIVGLDCHAGAPSQFLCQVGFIKRDDGDARVYLDAALVERRDGAWKLLRGLCKRLL